VKHSRFLGILGNIYVGANLLEQGAQVEKMKTLGEKNGMKV